jgi:phospholipid/cholesterol/gamma-HCH transport system substrate-binding protein
MLIERSHFVSGLVVGALLLVGTTYAVTLQAGALAAGDDIVVELADADRVEAGAPVQIAGVRVGQVMGVEIVGDRVHVTIRTAQEIPADSLARVTTTNALGARAITLDVGEDWDELLNEADEPRIPLERTEQLVDLPDVTDETVELLEGADTEAAARLFSSLADVTEDQHEELGELLEGLQRVGGVVEDNRAELETFLADTGELLDVLNDVDGDLVRTIDGIGRSVAALNARRDELVEFARSSASFSSTTADLVSEERERIDEILDEVAALLATVDEHQVDLAHILGYGGVAFEGFSSVGQSQGVDNPYWGNIFTTGLGAAGAEPFAGCGGMLDQMLDELLGPGPECPAEEQSRLGDEAGATDPDSGAPDPARSLQDESGDDAEDREPADPAATSLERFLTAGGAR